MKTDTDTKTPGRATTNAEVAAQTARLATQEGRKEHESPEAKMVRALANPHDELVEAYEARIREMSLRISELENDNAQRAPQFRQESVRTIQRHELAGRPGALGLSDGVRLIARHVESYRVDDSSGKEIIIFTGSDAGREIARHVVASREERTEVMAFLDEMFSVCHVGPI